MSDLLEAKTDTAGQLCDPVGQTSPWHTLRGILLTALAFAILRMITMSYDTGYVYQVYIPASIGYLSRGLGPILIFVAVGTKPLSHKSETALFWACAGVVSICSLLLALPLLPEGSVVPLVVRGLGQAAFGWMYAYLALVYSRFTIRNVILSTAISTALTPLMLLTTSFFPDILATLAACLAPFVVVAIFAKCRAQGYTTFEKDSLAPGRIELLSGAFPSWPVILVSLMFVLGVVNAVGPISLSGADGSVSYLVYIASSVGFSIIILASVILRSNFSLSLCWALFLAIILTATIMSFMDPAVLPLAYSLLAGARYNAGALLNVKFAEVGFRLQVPQHLVFALGWGIALVFQVLGSALVSIFIYVEGITPNAPAIMLVSMVFFGLFFLTSGSTFADIRNAGVHVAAPRDAEGEASGGIIDPDELYRRCQALIATYGITKRECEVVFLAAQGRTQTGIADALVVSVNTVRTHMKHVYTKLGIHSQKELLGLLGNER